jgi:nucleotide-binding universal stress UspA family protein
MFGSARHVIGSRRYSTAGAGSDDSSSASAAAPSAGEFAKAAEETLEDLQDRLEEAGLDEDLDISYSVPPHYTHSNAFA